MRLHAANVSPIKKRDFSVTQDQSQRLTAFTSTRAYKKSPHKSKRHSALLLIICPAWLEQEMKTTWLQKGHFIVIKKVDTRRRTVFVGVKFQSGLPTP